MNLPVLALVVLSGAAVDPAGVPRFGTIDPLVTDSVEVHRGARRAQERFERIRVEQSPLQWGGGAAPCDERVGRFCVLFSGGNDRDELRNREMRWRPQPDPPRVAQARTELLDTLAAALARFPGDGWVAGQLVSYLIETGLPEEALGHARGCGADPGWCAALEGYALHELGRFAEAERAFEVALVAMAPPTRRRWEGPEWILEVEPWRVHRGLRDEVRASFEANFWRLANPLFLLDGNALRTAQFARHTLARIRAEARTAHGIPWGEDLEELLVRYGPVVAFSRERPTGAAAAMGVPLLIGHYPPGVVHLLPDGGALEAPALSDPESWRTDRRRTRSRHGVPGLRRIYEMEAQVAVFPFGDSVRVVTSWTLSAPFQVDPPPAGSAWAAVEDPEPEFPPRAPRGALFLVDADPAGDAPWGSVRAEIRMEGLRGFASVTAPATHNFLSIEVIDEVGERGWRHRRGIAPPSQSAGGAGLSDLLLLEPLPGPPGDPDSASLETLLLRALSSTRLHAGRVEIAWGVSELGPDDLTLRYRLAIEPEGAGWLRRTGERLRVVRPEPRVEVRWDEGVEPAPLATPGDPHLRRVILDLSHLSPGHHRLSLTLQLPGRPPVTATREVEIIPLPDPGVDFHR